MKIKLNIIAFLLIFSFLIIPIKDRFEVVYSYDISPEFYTVYDSENEESILFVRGDGVSKDDEYISSDNRLYVIEEIDEANKTGKARYKENVKMPVYNVKKKINDIEEVYASSGKAVAMYHTHNDESYEDVDGTDSVYGKGGIHDVGLELKTNLENLGITVAYSENLHLPHNSGAYTRSEETASELLNNNDVSAIFDIHRDATPRSEYITEVNGVPMSKVRMVVGMANQNYAVNKEFALCIKSYADEVYPGLIKDIYLGKGNYNHQLSSRAMLFEMGSHLIEKDLVLASTVPLSKVIDIVLFGTKQASSTSTDDVEETSSEEDSLLQTGLVNYNSDGTIPSGTNAELNSLWVVLGSLGFVILVAAIFYICSSKTRHAVNRFFSELTAGIFRRRKKNTIKNDFEE